jgi:hypothetical protein
LRQADTIKQQAISFDADLKRPEVYGVVVGHCLRAKTFLHTSSRAEFRPNLTTTHDLRDECRVQ